VADLPVGPARLYGPVIDLDGLRGLRPTPSRPTHWVGFVEHGKIVRPRASRPGTIRTGTSYTGITRVPRTVQTLSNDGSAHGHQADHP